MLQAEFSEINLAAYSDSGTVVDIQVSRGGTKVVRYVLSYTAVIFEGGHVEHCSHPSLSCLSRART